MSQYCLQVIITMQLSRLSSACTRTFNQSMHAWPNDNVNNVRSSKTGWDCRYRQPYQGKLKKGPR